MTMSCINSSVCISIFISLVIASTQKLCYLIRSNTWKPVKTEKYVMDFYPVSYLFWLDCVNVISYNSGGLHYNACSK